MKLMKLFILVFLSVCSIAQISAESKRWIGRNVCRYTKQEVFYKMKKTFSRRCHLITKICDEPDYPFLNCKEVRCEEIMKWLPEKYTKYQHKTECCPGWRSRWENHVGSLFNGCSKLTSCITLPQYTPKPCSKERQEKLISSRGIYRLTTPPKAVPENADYSSLIDVILFPVVNLTAVQLVRMSLANPNEKSWLSIYLKMSRTNSKTANESLQPENVRIFHNFSEYVNLLDPFRKNLRTGGPLDKYFRYPSEEEYFKDIIESDIWQEDNIFVEQRLAGLNPMVLKKLRLREYLEKRPNLNPELDNAIAKAAGQKTNMLQMVKKGLVYMIEYPLLRNLTNVPDIIERHPKDGRKMRHSISPLAFFLSVQNCVTKTYELKPVAIQMDFLASSPVFSPVDGSKWTLAKQEVQLADVTHSQIIEHLLKTHLLMERICVTVKRTLSEFHPLHQIFMWHCRGTLTVNGLGLPNLLDEYQFMHRLFAIGNIGAIELTNKGYKESSWADTEFEENLKKRGVDDTEKLPYFPYRDDGMIMWRLIKGFATEYVDLYYHNDRFVSNDKELQKFANELSADGVGPNGGQGMVKGFPSKISTKEEIVDLVARIVFVPVQHHTVNYPISYYVGFVPNMPMKLYDDPRVPPDEFGLYSLPQYRAATTQVLLTMTLGSYRFDNFFDYGPQMEDKKAGKLVMKYYKHLMGPVRKEFTQRNKQRLLDGHLTYPYLLPGWMPNSVNA